MAVIKEQENAIKTCREKKKRILMQEEANIIKKVSLELVEIALMNPFKVVVTLTFREDIQTYKIAINRWKNYMRRMKWRYGDVWISKIETREGKLKSIHYMTKYMCKSIQERIERGESVRGERFFSVQEIWKSLKSKKLEERLSIQDLIFDNMENVIRDGVYDIKDFNGKVINRMEFVEYMTINRGDKND